MPVFWVRKVRTYVQSGNGVLLKAHRWNKETVDHVLSPQMQLRGLTHGNNHGCRNNIVASSRIARINAQRIAFSSPCELLRVSSAEHSVSSRVAEIPLKLCARNFNLYLAQLILFGPHA